MNLLMYRLLKISAIAFACFCSTTQITKAQVTPDGTVNTTVNQNGNVSEITGGQTEGSNLFHSFQDFSVPTGNEANFINADTIENIFSRVRGGNISNIDGLISTSGSANLFLINPAGIIFGENARLDVGGSFIGSSANSILFPDGVEFSASDAQPQPILTINAPIGLNFRDNPGDIVNRADSFDDGDTPDNVFDDFTIGLRVGDDQTIGLIGGNVSFDGGFVTARGGRIEVGSVAENSIVSLTEIESGWDIGYENVTNFQDLNLANFAQIGSFSQNGEVTGDVQVRGRNITLTQGSQLGVFSQVGQAGDVSVLASESITIDGNSIEIGGDNVSSSIFNVINNEASGENSQITIETPQLNLTNGGAINAFNVNSTSQGVGISIAVSEIFMNGTINFDTDSFIPTGVLAQTFPQAVGDGGNITIETAKLIVNSGAEINTETFGVGNAGDLIVNANESVELVGTNLSDVNLSDVNPSGLQANVEQSGNTTGNGGDITVNTPRLIVKDGAQISSLTSSQGTGGNITVDASESILLSGIAPSTELDIGRTGITVSAAPFVSTELTEPIQTTGNAGNLNIETNSLIVEQGAIISANAFSLGNGGNAEINVNNLTIRNGGQIRAGSLLLDNAADNQLGRGGNLNITATDSVSITGVGGINGETVTSSISTIAEGTGDAGNLTLTTGELAISDRGEINASATGNGTTGGDIILTIADNLTLDNESQISAEALGNANGGNINIDSNSIVAFSSQPDGSDIITSAEQGTGGEINITAKSVFGIDRGEAVAGNGTNDIDASSRFGLDGNVSINVLDVEAVGDMTELPTSLTAGEQTIAQVCQSSSSETNTLIVRGKGGIIKQPIEPFDSEAIVSIQNNNIQSKQSQSSEIKTFQTSKGEIIPAQGAIVTKDGEVILTPYATDHKQRDYDTSKNCG